MSKACLWLAYSNGTYNLIFSFNLIFQAQPWTLKRTLPVAVAVLVAVTKIEVTEERPKKAVFVPVSVTQTHRENLRMKFTQKYAPIIIQVKINFVFSGKKYKKKV